MALIVPSECSEQAATRGYIERLVASNGPIRQVLPVDVRQSMANGGGPACLRLRVVADPATVDPRFLLDEAKADAVEKVISQHWPESIEPFDLQFVSLEETVVKARQAILATLGLETLA